MGPLKCSLILSLVLLTATAYGQPTIGQVVWAKGTLKAIGPGKISRTLARRSAIYANDTLTTDATSSGQVIFTDNSLLAIRENTSLQIAKYQFNKVAQQETFAAHLAKGGFRTITGAIATDNPSNYSTNTPVATIGVRGTEYSIYYSTQKGMAAKLEHGIITVSNAYGTVTLKKCTPAELKNTQKPCKDQLYARVTSANSAPELVSKQPEEFNNDVKIVTVSVTGGGTGGPSGGNSSGTVDSFSINMPCPE